MEKKKYDFYQSNSHIVVAVLKRGVSEEHCSVQCTADGHLTVTAEGENVLDIQLYRPIVPNSPLVKCLPSKIEIRLEKVVPEYWEKLEAKIEEKKEKPERVGWERVLKDMDEEEEKEGDINTLFQKIYQNADDDTKKAMMKSFTESGGTVLSTNWNEIGKKRTEVRPPDGMEFKKW